MLLMPRMTTAAFPQNCVLPARSLCALLLLTAAGSIYPTVGYRPRAHARRLAASPGAGREKPLELIFSTGCRF
jgi:hypothetical protein